jgi:hypothetical protein
VGVNSMDWLDRYLKAPTIEAIVEFLVLICVDSVIGNGRPILGLELVLDVGFWFSLILSGLFFRQPEFTALIFFINFYRLSCLLKT